MSTEAKELGDKFKILVKSVKTLSVRTPEVQQKEFKRLAQSVDRLLLRMSSRYRKVWFKAQNLLSSLSDGAPTGDLTVKVFNSAIIELDNFADQLLEIDRKAEDKKPSGTGTDGGSEGPTALDTWTDEQDADTEKVIRKYASYRGMLPTTMPPNKRFLVTRAPVVVVAKHGMNIDKLKQLRLVDDTIFYYPVIKNQVVVGINAQWATDNHENSAEALQFVLDAIKERTGKTYIALGSHTSNGSVNYYWVISSVDYRRLAPAFIKAAVIKSWSFPFDTKKDKLEQRSPN